MDAGGPAFARGLLYGALLDLAVLGAQHLAKTWSSGFTMPVFLLVLATVVGRWPIAPRPVWWQKAAATVGVFAVLLPIVLVDRAFLPYALWPGLFFGIGLWPQHSRRRPRITDPPRQARDATWAP